MMMYERKKMELRPFADQIKEELDEEDYNQYRDVLQSYSQKQITKSQTLARLNRLFIGHDNLLLGLNNLFHPQSTIDIHSDSDDVVDDDDKTCFGAKLGRAIEFAEKMRSFDSSTQVWNKRLKSEVDLPDFYTHIESIIDKTPDMRADFNEFYSVGVSDESDESVLIRISPSYLLKPSPADVKNIGTDSDVLNHVWACRRPVEKDGDPMSYKEGGKPMMEYENEMEDEIFHVDMLFHTLKSTAAVVQKYVDGLLIKEIGEEDYLKPTHFRCIESLYGDYGLEMINMLRCNPERVSPVLLKRLNQKLDEMRSCYPRLKFVIDGNCL